jgi:hypothetical protein
MIASRNRSVITTAVASPTLTPDLNNSWILTGSPPAELGVTAAGRRLAITARKQDQYLTVYPNPPAMTLIRSAQNENETSLRIIARIRQYIFKCERYLMVSSLKVVRTINARIRALRIKER